MSQTSTTLCCYWRWGRQFLPARLFAGFFFSCIFAASAAWAQPCNISVSVGTAGTCDPATGYYTIPVTVTYGNPPTEGFLKIGNQTFDLATLPPSPAMLSLTGLIADGKEVNTSAFFTAAPACTTDLGWTAPAACKAGVIATMRDELADDVNGNNTANPGDEIKYTIEIQNNDADKTGVETDVTPDPNTTLDPGSIMASPLAYPDLYATGQDAMLTVNAAMGLLDNDRDVLPVNGALTAASGTFPTTLGGSITVNADGSFAYTPPTGQGGVTDTYVYTITDSDGMQDQSTVSIDLNACPVAVDDDFSTDENTVLNVGNVLTNDTDTDPLTVVSVNGVMANVGVEITLTPSGAKLTLNANGTFSFNPDGQFEDLDDTESEPVTFTYTVSDGNAACAGAGVEATVTITVNGVNDCPAAVIDNHSTDEDTPLNVAVPGVLSNDTDADIESLTVGQVNGSNANVGALVNLGSGAQVTVNADGSFTYNPNGAFNSLPMGGMASDNFTYTATDGTCQSNAATVTIDITGVNDLPTAVDDSYNAAQDQLLTVNTGMGVLANDTDPDVPDTKTVTQVNGMAVVGMAFTLPSGAVVTMQTDGSFTYNAKCQVGGMDSFTYTLQDGAGATSMATVNLTVAQTIWFVDGGVAMTGAGSFASPFKTLAEAETASSVNHTIFVFHDAASYTGGIDLKNGQLLIGEGQGLTCPADGSTIVAAGSYPTIEGGVTTMENNTIRGIIAGSNVNDYAVEDVAAGNFGTLTITNSSINNPAGGAFLASGGTLAVTLSSLSAGGGTGTLGVSLNSVSGSFSATGGAINNPDGVAFGVSGSSATVAYGGTITKNNNANSAVSVASSSGNVILSGNITAGTTTANAINLTGNSNTVSFSGTLVLTTTSGVGFNATGGGTIAATGANSTISSTSAAALNVANTTIGAANLNFRSISSGNNTAAADPANGIVLNNTGASGGLIVSGDGGGANNGSGGTIQNTTGAGIVINNAINTSLGYLNITNSGTDGINANTINGFTLNRCTIIDNGGALTDQGVQIGDFTTGTAVNGAINITNTSITQSPHDNLAVGIGSGTSTWTITGSTFSLSGNTYVNGYATVGGNSGINFEIRNAAAVTAFNMSNCILQGNFADGIQISPAPGSTASLTATIQNCTFNNNNISMDLNSDGSATMTYNVLNNTMINTTRRATAGVNGASHAMNVFMAAASTASASIVATIQGNVIGDANIDGSGSSFGNGMRLNFNGNGRGTVLVNNNNIREAPVGRGIEVIGRNGTGQLDITLTANNVDHLNLPFNPGSSDFPLAAIFVQSSMAGVSGYTVRSDVRSNTVPAGASFDLLPTYIVLVETSTSNLQLVDTPPASADATAQLTSTNTGSASANAGVSLIPGPIQTP